MIFIYPYLYTMTIAIVSIVMMEEILGIGQHYTIEHKICKLKLYDNTIYGVLSINNNKILFNWKMDASDVIADEALAEEVCNFVFVLLLRRF